jgi:hypothetical protein
MAPCPKLVSSETWGMKRFEYVSEKVYRVGMRNEIGYLKYNIRGVLYPVRFFSFAVRVF